MEATRDELEEQILECGKEQPKKLQHLKAQCLDAVHGAERMRKLRKHCEDKINETIEEGDNLELIDTLDPEPSRAKLLKEMVAPEVPEEEAEGAEQDELVGAGAD